MGVDLQGKIAPPFTLKDIDGRTVSLTDYRGHPVVVNFWATYCGPCKEEMPWFTELEAKYKDQGLIILGVNQDEDMARSDIARAVKRVGISYPILLSDHVVSMSYGGVDYLPETFYVDRGGKVTRQTAGVPTKDEIEANIRVTMASGV